MELTARTERSLSSVVIPRKVSCRDFFANGASITIGSRKYPIDLDRGQSCDTGPPDIIPGLSMMAVPDYLSIEVDGWNVVCIPVTDISMIVPFVTFSSRRRRLISKSIRACQHAFDVKPEPTWDVGYLSNQDFCPPTESYLCELASHWVRTEPGDFWGIGDRWSG